MIMTTPRPNQPLLLLTALLLALLPTLAHGSPLATPALVPRQPLAPAAAAPAQATPTTAPRLPYPIPDSYNGTAFLRHGGTGGGARATGAMGTGTGRPPRRPQVTAAPGNDRNGSVVAAAQKDIPFIQTTYWSCVQWPTTVHCGWHEPILAVGDAAVNAAGDPSRGGTAAAAVRRAGAVVGGLLLAGLGLGVV